MDQPSYFLFKVTWKLQDVALDFGHLPIGLMSSLLDQPSQKVEFSCELLRRVNLAQEACDKRHYLYLFIMSPLGWFCFRATMLLRNVESFFVPQNSFDPLQIEFITSSTLDCTSAGSGWHQCRFVCRALGSSNHLHLSWEESHNQGWYPDGHGSMSYPVWHLSNLRNSSWKLLLLRDADLFHFRPTWGSTKE